MQHQELLLTDLMHAFSGNPTNPAYQSAAPNEVAGTVPALSWQNFDGGIVAIGHDGEGFGFDCEGPRHEALIQPFGLASRPGNQWGVARVHGRWRLWGTAAVAGRWLDGGAARALAGAIILATRG